MASKLIPSDPEKVMVLRKIHPDILTCSVPFLRFGRVKIGGRGTVVKLQTGALAVFSPVALTDSVQQELSKLGSGQIKYITALDAEHHIFLEPWHKAFPEAKVIGPEGLKEKRENGGDRSIPEQNWVIYRKADKTNGGLRVSDEFDAEFESEFVDAHANKELVFNHKPSKTLIEADFMFNLPANEQMSRTQESPTSGLLTRIMCAINSTKGDAIWQRRFIWYAISASDRQGFNESVGRIDRFDFDTVVPCHGDVIEKEGKTVFQKVMKWHLDAARAKTQ
ncbi:hypothetical protein MBLNU230_g4678t1 [Neophaeotheca triangularis]